MNTSKFIAICLISGAALTISQSSSAQIRLGVSNAAHLSAATSLNTPSVSNALRASSTAATGTASQVKAAGTTAAKSTVNTTNEAETKTAAAPRRIEAKTTTRVEVQASA